MIADSAVLSSNSTRWQGGGWAVGLLLALGAYLLVEAVRKLWARPGTPPARPSA